MKAYCLTEQEYRDVILWANLPAAEKCKTCLLKGAWGWVKRDVDKASRRYV
ncbi:MAG: hypothetical protein IPH10_08920 [bacterium]|nr:hypothetical protein [bacterium]